VRVNAMRVYHSSTRIQWYVKRHRYGISIACGLGAAVLSSIALRAGGVAYDKVGALSWLIGYIASGVAYCATGGSR